MPLTIKACITFVLLMFITLILYTSLPLFSKLEKIVEVAAEGFGVAALASILLFVWTEA